MMYKLNGNNESRSFGMVDNGNKLQWDLSTIYPFHLWRARKKGERVSPISHSSV